MTCMFVHLQLFTQSTMLNFLTYCYRFLLPVKDCEFVLTSIIENLQRDPWPVANDKRPQRCTGVAMDVAVGLMEVGVSGMFVKRIHENEDLN